MTRIAVFFPVIALTLIAAHAPIQCTRTPDPDTRLEDQPGDALWHLAEKFRNDGNRAAADSTLRFLIEKYPSDRHAPLAREMLSGASPSASTDGGA